MIQVFRLLFPRAQKFWGYKLQNPSLPKEIKPTLQYRQHHFQLPIIFYLSLGSIAIELHTKELSLWLNQCLIFARTVNEDADTVLNQISLVRELA